MKGLSEKYLTECDERAHNADSTHWDAVLNDLRKRINTLTNHVRRCQGMPITRKPKALSPPKHYQKLKQK